MDLAMVLLDGHAQHCATLGKLHYLKTHQHVESAQLHAALGIFHYFFAPDCFALLAQAGLLTRYLARSRTRLRPDVTVFECPASNRESVYGTSIYGRSPCAAILAASRSAGVLACQRTHRNAKLCASASPATPLTAAPASWPPSLARNWPPVATTCTSSATLRRSG